MEPQKLDVFDRAALFLKKERLASAGFTADLKVVRVDGKASA